MLKLTTTLVLALGLAAPSAAQCDVTTYGQACGAVSASGFAEPNGNTVRVSFTISGARAGSPILFLVGGPEARIPLLDTDCFLLLQPVFAQNHVAGHDGTYTFSKALPQEFAGRARVQFAEIQISPQRVDFFTTNGLLLDCTGN